MQDRIAPHDNVDLYEKAHSDPYSLAEVREKLSKEFPWGTEVFFRVATREERADGLYIQFLPALPESYSIAAFVEKLSKFTPETEFLVVYQKGRRHYCNPTFYISQLDPVPLRVR